MGKTTEPFFINQGNGSVCYVINNAQKYLFAETRGEKKCPQLLFSLITVWKSEKQPAQLYLPAPASCQPYSQEKTQVSWHVAPLDFWF